jgi:formamidopyrimidine-DNA glycosylase
MPELPEVETIARALEAQLSGRTIVRSEVRWPRAIACPSADDFARQIRGRRVRSISRRGKFLVFALDHGFLLAHLRMTGRLLLCDAAHQEDCATPFNDAHTHVYLYLDGDKILRFRDVRKFGRLYLVEDPAQVLGELGLEPLEPTFTVAALGELLRGSRRLLKPFLLDQRRLAGLGNIYADEALWRAGLHPLRRSDGLSVAEVVRLHAAIQDVLREAIAHGGTTLRDYRSADDAPGRHQWSLAVYGREGQPCLRCGEAIVRMVVQQRSSYYCPRCQPAAHAAHEGCGGQ